MKLIIEVKLIKNCYNCPNWTLGSEADEGENGVCLATLLRDDDGKEYDDNYWFNHKRVDESKVDIFRECADWCPLQDAPQSINEEIKNFAQHTQVDIKTTNCA